MAQNKRPVFTKAMLGYTPREVDLYIDRMNERYSAALADNSKLRRRVESLQAELARARADARAAEGSRDAEHLLELIKNEASRHLETLGDIISAPSAQSAVSDASRGASHELPCTAAEIDEADGFVPLEDDVPEELTAASPVDAAQYASPDTTADAGGADEYTPEDLGYAAQPADDAHPDDRAAAVSDVSPDASDMAADITASTEDDASVGDDLFYDDALELFTEEYGPHELDDASIFAAPDEIFIDTDRERDSAAGIDSVEDFNNIKSSADGLGGDNSARRVDATAAEDEENTETAEDAAVEASAAQRTASLDFYTDTVVRDGESFDPMTLAHRRTLTRRPTLEDFMRPLGDGEKPTGSR